MLYALRGPGGPLKGGISMGGFTLRITGCLIVVVLTIVLTVFHLRGGTGQADPYRVPTASAQTSPSERGPDPTERREWGPAGPRAAPEAVVSSDRDGDRKVYGPVEPHRPKRDVAFVPDELVVRFGRGVSAANRQTVNAAFGANEIERLERLNAYRIRLPSGSDVPALVRAYQEHPLVELAQPNVVYTAHLEPSDPAYTEIQHWYYHVTNAPAGWDIETGSADVVVAVLDTGVDITHPDLDGQIWVNTGEIAGNGVDDDGNGCVDDVNGCDFSTPTPNGNPDDDFGHGTFVSGTICGEPNNAVSGAGTASTPRSLIWPPT